MRRARSGSLGLWITHLLLLAWMVGMLGCSDRRVGRADTAFDDGALRGQLIEYIDRFDDGTTKTTYALRANGRQRELVFDIAPDVPAMTEVKVWGRERDSRLYVERIEAALDDEGEGI